MPPARPVLVLLGIVALPTLFTLFSLLSAHPGRDSSAGDTTSQRGSFRSFFSFHTPASLFPPAAIISLTDDNSTFFLARPADFGPRLISNGLSGQLWVGSGFGDDNVRRGGAATGPEGELGCSDVPGWEDGDKERHGDVGLSGSKYRRTGLPTSEASSVGNTITRVHAEDTAEVLSDKSDPSGLATISGTDDHLHFPLPDSQVSKPSISGQRQQHASSAEEHADIQSLQETAEITGKMGAKTGAAALIVGDDTRGGALVTMYARGDTSNVTIPSLFTSHTTAHLLSSLIPPESPDEDDFEADTESEPGTLKPLADGDRPTFTASVKEARFTSAPQGRRIPVNPNNKASNRRKKNPKNASGVRKQSIWQKLGFSKVPSDQGLDEDSRRPPSSGRLSWVNEKFNDELVLEKRNSRKLKATQQPQAKSRTSSKGQHAPGDGFEIGIQDWRDPDLVATKVVEATENSKSKPLAAVATPSKSGISNEHEPILTPDGKKTFAGGSITPGSGEYGQFPKPSPIEDEEKDDSWFGHALWGDDSEYATDDDDKLQMASSHLPQGTKQSLPDQEEHEGLWVTLTPTTMSTTPFFDTLLVLIASPLITLTVVYALLLLRSRIRRRRWRAPKSVVERLPIRTYQTMPTSSTTSSARMATPFTSSPTSPLLQSRAQSIHSRSRAQSKVGSEMGDRLSVSLDKATAQAAAQSHGKLEQAVAKKKKYRGRQIECVVCLEEYVEGYSQVMSLPCGHEFHAECITPWLTTRRRTCPICKNDVVRSMARSSNAAEGSHSNTHYHGVSQGDDVQALAAETTNESPSAAIPIPRDNNDIERGDDMADTLVEDQSGRRGWRGLASLSLSAFSGEAAWRQAQADRNR
ncbi:hypothetical protein G7Y79_00008g022970 [Physcia stellaris]|nr:hypothetical protein G7Y79_00008g022970 [Physcia stellaris]